MQRGRDSELIFPIKDAASPALVLIKADCLHTAGIINEAEKQYVHSRARTFLDTRPSKTQPFKIAQSVLWSVSRTTRLKSCCGHV
jgi:hypothetical protein